MPKVFVTGDGDNRVTGVVHRPDETYTAEGREARREQVPFAVAELDDLLPFPPEDATVDRDGVREAPVVPGRSTVSAEVAELEDRRGTLDALLADAALPDGDWVKALHERHTLMPSPE